jgi:catechol 2,3-dioxygenase-like lactoylglutathione lyase family enzyme
VAVPIRHPTQMQTLVAVRDVEASSRWYQHLLGLRGDHGGSTHDHHHGMIGQPESELGNGVLLWFGETADFDRVIARAVDLGATVVLPELRNPSDREGNDPSHREIWLKDPDGCTIVVPSRDGEAFEPPRTGRHLT